MADHFTYVPGSGPIDTDKIVRFKESIHDFEVSIDTLNQSQRGAIEAVDSLKAWLETGEKALGLLCPIISQAILASSGASTDSDPASTPVDDLVRKIGEIKRTINSLHDLVR